MRNKLLCMMAIMLFCGGIGYAQLKAVGEPKAIAKMNEPLRLPVWSPDGEKIAMTSLKNEGIWVIDKNGKNLRQITSDKGAGFRPKWSADNSSLLARTSVTENGRIFNEVKVYDLQTGSEELIVSKTRDLKGLPYWSDDNSSVEYKLGNQLKSSPRITGITPTANKKQENSLFNKMLEDPATVTSQMSELSEIRNFIVFNSTLSPQGDKIAFQVNNGKGLYICNVDGSNLKNLGKGENATWSIDGKYLIVSVTEDNGYIITKSDLYCIDINSGQRAPLLTSNKYIALNPAMSPNGKTIAFEEYTTGAIYLMDIK